MRATFQQICSVFTAVLVLTMTVPSSQAADDHVVPLKEIEKQVRLSAERRTTNMADIERVLSYPAAKQELAKYNVTPGQVHQAMATLSDAELNRLADRARASENDVQGGLIVGILALIGLIVVIIIVVALVADATPRLPRDCGVECRTSIPQVAAVHGC